MEPLMSCNDAELMLAAVALDAAEDVDMGALRRHLRECASCRSTAAGFQHVADLIPLSVELVEPPPQLRSRLLSIVHAEAAGSVTPSRRVSRWRALWQRIPAARGVSLVGALAMVAVVILAVVAATGRHQPAPAPAVASYAVQGCGLTPQPNACANLTVYPASGQGVLAVNGLAPITSIAGRPTGVYEVWLIRSDRHPEPAAFLSLQPDGHTWTAAVPVDVSRHVAIAMTEEPYPNGSPSPTGAVVLQLALPPAPHAS